MATSAEQLQFNGSPPDLAGKICTGFVVQHFYEGSGLADPANVVFLCFEGTWHRLYFETGTVFWRFGDAPEPAVNSTLAHGLLLNDLSEMPGIVGHQLGDITYSGNERGDVGARLLFRDGTTISLQYDTGADSTRIDA